MQSLSSGICYVIAQCLGGILGAAGAFYSLPGQHPSSIVIMPPCMLIILGALEWFSVNNAHCLLQKAESSFEQSHVQRLYSLCSASCP